MAGERGGNGLFITLVPKVYNNVFLFVGLTTLGDLLNFDWLYKCCIKINVQIFPPIILIQQRGNFVYHHCGCTSTIVLLL